MPVPDTGMGMDAGTESMDESGAPQLSGDTAAAETDRARIEQRAYEIYMARGGEAGRELDDWLSAERELNGGRESGGDEDR